MIDGPELRSPSPVEPAGRLAFHSFRKRWLNILVWLAIRNNRHEYPSAELLSGQLIIDQRLENLRLQVLAYGSPAIGCQTLKFIVDSI
jgi:hypothetical protein